MECFVKFVILLMKLHWDQNIMLSSNHTFYMFALPGIRISNVIIELACYKGKLWELFISLILMNVPLPYFQKQKFWNILILSKWRAIFLLINLYQVLCTLYSPKCIYLRMITTTTTVDLQQMVFQKFPLIILQFMAQNHLKPQQ